MKAWLSKLAVLRLKNISTVLGFFPGWGVIGILVLVSGVMALLQQWGDDAVVSELRHRALVLVLILLGLVMILRATLLCIYRTRAWFWGVPVEATVRYVKEVRRRQKAGRPTIIASEKLMQVTYAYTDENGVTHEGRTDVPMEDISRIANRRLVVRYHPSAPHFSITNKRALF